MPKLYLKANVYISFKVVTLSANIFFVLVKNSKNFVICYTKMYLKDSCDVFVLLCSIFSVIYLKTFILQLPSCDCNQPVPDKQHHLLSLEMMLFSSFLHCNHLGSFASTLHAAFRIFGPLWLLGRIFFLFFFFGRECSCFILFGESNLIVSKYCYDENY